MTRRADVRRRSDGPLPVPVQCQWPQRQKSHWPQRGWGRALDRPRNPRCPGIGVYFPDPRRPNRESPPAAGSDGSYWCQTRRARRGWLRTRTGLLKRQPQQWGLGPAGTRTAPSRGLRAAGRGRPQACQWLRVKVTPWHQPVPGPGRSTGPAGAASGWQAHGLHEVRPQRDFGLRRRLVPDRTCSADSGDCQCPHRKRMRLPVKTKTKP